MAPKTKRKIILKSVPTNCPFCNKGIEPDFIDYKYLARYLSDRAKIMGRARTGVCTKHQRRVSIAIKRARYLGLLPYVPRI